MKSGGAITFEPSNVTDTSRDSNFDDTEIAKGLTGVPRGTNPVNLSDDADVSFNGQTYKWKELKDDIKKEHPAAAGGNLSPEELKAEIARQQAKILGELSKKTEEVDQKKMALDSAKQALQRSDTPANQQAKAKAERELNQAKAELATLIQQAKAQGIKDTQAQMASASQHLADSSEPTSSSGSGNTGFGEARASVTSSSSGPLGGQTNGTQGSNNGTGARAMGTGNGGGSSSLFDGLNPPSSAAYARALYMDNLISDGLGQVGNRTREGQRLMMLFLYYARMAESGDLGAMYQFMKFITYIISKDKAKQNIQVSTQLIKLQDQSRKASDALMGTDNKDQTEFTKMLQKTQSEQSQIATSQKLLADMLQEFAQVVETLTNSVKNVLDAWGRVQRTASSR